MGTGRLREDLTYRKVFFVIRQLWREKNVTDSIVDTNQYAGKDRGMKYGARNQLKGNVTSITLGDVMSLIKFEVTVPSEMASVITTESVNDLNLKVGDQVQLIVKAIHVLPVKS